MSNLLRRVTGRHPLMFAVVVTVIVGVVLVGGIFLWGWDVGSWDLPGQ